MNQEKYALTEISYFTEHKTRYGRLKNCRIVFRKSVKKYENIGCEFVKRIPIKCRIKVEPKFVQNFYNFNGLKVVIKELLLAVIINR